MSAINNKPTAESLSPYTRSKDAWSDGANVTTVQKRFEQRLRGALARINAEIREAVIEDDLFNYHRQEALVDEPDPERFNFPSYGSAELVRRFILWLDSQLESEFLEIVGEDRNEFVEKAYMEGLRFATNELRNGGLQVEKADQDILNRPIHVASLQRLFTRTFGNLESIKEDIVKDVREELTEGFAQGRNPTEIARRLTNRVDSIGKHRATLVARSEIINAHSEAAVTRYEQADAEVGVNHSEWLAADDDRTCPFCNALDGNVLTLSEVRNKTVEFAEDEEHSLQTFRLMPPAHPQCRCTVSAVIGVDVGSLPDLEERTPGSVN